MPDRHDMTLAGLEAPYWCEPLLRPFGQTPWGENIFRVVWAPRRLQMYGGFRGDNGLFEYGWVRRYGKLKAWVFERWLPTRHFGSPQLWAAQTANGEGYLSAGPYPQYGLFVCGYMFANPDHSYLPILPDLVLLTAQGIHTGRVKKNWEIRGAVLSEEQAKEQAIRDDFERRWQETHGVRRGMTFSKDGVIQNNLAEMEAY